MKLHLPFTLLTAVLAAFIVLPALAAEVPDGYTTTYLTGSDILRTYSTLTNEDYKAFILDSSQEFTPTNNDYWTDSTPLVSDGNVFFSSDVAGSPVALSFKNGNGTALSEQNELTFDTLSNLTFSTIEGAGAAISLSGGALTITNVKDNQSATVDVLFEDIKNTSISSRGGAIYAGSANVAINNNGDVTFSSNSCSDYGGAIYTDSDVIISNNGDVAFSYNNTTYGGGAIDANTVHISGNGDVSFSFNSSSYNYSNGGAINASSVTINNNGDVSFSYNSAYYYSFGGAIYSCDGNVTLSYNNNVSFSSNSAFSRNKGTANSYGGAIYASNSDVTLSYNNNVSFSYNSAYAASDGGNSYATYLSFGGAIYATSCGVILSNNSDISFCNNYASSYYSKGGAIYSDEGLTISNNRDISFCDNYASSNASSSMHSYAAYGGAISTHDKLTLNNNGDISFCANSAKSQYASSYGGAIYATRGLSIQGNDSVLFEKNYEKSASAYRLRSIYSEDSMTLSAKTGGNITFYDSIYTSDNTNFNSDYTDADGNTKRAKGDVIFSGKYAEQHLNEILANYNEGRTATAEEIRNSQTSVIGENVYVNGGSVQIVDGAVLKVNGNTVSIEAGSDATLAINDAELIAENAKVEVGASATLQLSNGASITADEINIMTGATLALGDIAITTSAIDSMVATYRVSSLNVINADLTFAAGSTLVTDGSGISMTEGTVLTFAATGSGEKINLVFTLGTEYNEDGLLMLFSNVDIVKFLIDGNEVNTSTSILASDFFTGDYISENTTLNYDSATGKVYLQQGGSVPEPTTATLSLLALAALAARRRRQK